VPTPDNQSKLTEAQRGRTKSILDHVRQDIATAANGDAAVEFAMRRYIYIRLSHDERSSPMQRRNLKVKKFDAQQGICTICKQPLGRISHSHLHRKNQLQGYSEANTELVHAECHRQQQAARNYS
jgi:hypothetical protein